jgi:hypothetical protein
VATTRRRHVRPLGPAAARGVAGLWLVPRQTRSRHPVTSSRRPPFALPSRARRARLGSWLPSTVRVTSNWGGAAVGGLEQAGPRRSPCRGMNHLAGVRANAPVDQGVDGPSGGRSRSHLAPLRLTSSSSCRALQEDAHQSEPAVSGLESRQPRFGPRNRRRRGSLGRRRTWPGQIDRYATKGCFLRCCPTSSKRVSGSAEGGSCPAQLSRVKPRSSCVLSFSGLWRSTRMPRRRLGSRCPIGTATR